MNVIREKNTEKLTQQAGELLGNLLNQYTDKNILLMISGGSAMKIVDHINPNLLGSNQTITTLDERFSTNPEVNNYAQLTKTVFYSNALAKNCRFIPTTINQDTSLDESTIDFEMSLREWRTANPDGKIIITQGIGEDSHTAGILPFPKNPTLFDHLFSDTETWIVGYEVDKLINPHSRRFTVNIDFLTNQVDHSIAYITGQNKKQALEKTLAPDAQLATTPASVIQTMKDVHVFTDIMVTAHA